MLTAERLRELFDYEPGSGEFRYKVRRNRALVGSICGWHNARGYLSFRVDGKMHYAHRLAWLHVHGRWPDAMIDHINGEKDDNRITNLREASRSQNLANSRVPSNNTSGFKCVSFYKKSGKWTATIMKDAKFTPLGRFETPEAAHAAYMAAAERLFGDFARAA
jgi:hypothetical protein